MLFTANRDGELEDSLRSGSFDMGGATSSSMRSRPWSEKGGARLLRWIGRLSPRENSIFNKEGFETLLFAGSSHGQP